MSASTVEDLIGGPRSKQSREALKALSIEWLSDPMRERRKDEIVAGLFGAAEIVILHADPKVGKTQLATDLSFAVSTGRPWFGRRVKAGRVLYLAGEKGRVTRKRFAAMQRMNDNIVPEIAITTVPISLDNEKMVEDIIAATRAIGNVVLIVLDTLNRAMAGIDENSAGAVGGVFNALTRVAEQTGAAIVVLHHNTKAGELRGSSAISASADVVMSLKEVSNGVRELSVDLANDASEGQTFRFRMEVVEVWPETDTQEAEETIVLKPVSDGAPSGAQPKYNHAEYARAERLVALLGALANGDIVSRGELLNEARQRGVVSKGNKSSSEQMRRGLHAGKELGLLDFDQKSVWLQSSQGQCPNPS